MKKYISVLIAAIMILILFPAGAFAQDTIPEMEESEVRALAEGNCYHVANEGNDTNDGLSWAMPLKTLEKALSLAVDGDTIYVYAGIYDLTVPLDITKDVKIYGGFKSGELSPDQRTLDSPPLSILDASYSCRVFNLLDRTNATVIDGFVIRNGIAVEGGGIQNVNSSPILANLTFLNNAATDRGGAIYNTYSSPTLTNVIIEENTATNGGGMYNEYSSPTLTDVKFNRNSARNNGGGMYNETSSPTMINVDFCENSAGNDGGGIYNDASSSTINSVRFFDNSARTNGGGINNLNSVLIANLSIMKGNTSDGNGGAIHNDSSQLVIMSCDLRGNSAAIGGGAIYNSNSSSNVTNCSFTGNESTENGGAIYNGNGSPLAITNATISGNKSDGTGGGIFNDSSDEMSLYNTILIGNSDGIGGGISLIRNSIVQDRSDAINGNLDATNITADNVFVSPIPPGQSVEGDFHLKEGSPAIDAGSTDYWDDSKYSYEFLDNQTLLSFLGDDWGLIEDIVGTPRIVNGTIDIGAYEAELFPTTTTTTITTGSTSSNPRTGDEPSVGLLIALMSVAGAGLLALFIRRRLVN